MSEHIVVDPKPIDEQWAEDLLDEIQAVLARKNCILKHSPQAITLAVANPAESNYRAIAQIAIITPGEITWRPIAYRPIKVN